MYASVNIGNAIFFKTVIFFARRASRLAGRRASHVHDVALDVASVVALVFGESGDFRVSRRVPSRVPNRARAGVFCRLDRSIILYFIVLCLFIVVTWCIFHIS